MGRLLQRKMKKGQKQRTWTDEEIAYMRQTYDGTRRSLEVISITLGIHIENIRVKIKRLGFYIKTDNSHKPWKDDEIKKLRELYQTHTTKEIAQSLSRGFYSVEEAIGKFIQTKIRKQKVVNRKIKAGCQKCSKCNIVKPLSEFEQINRNQCNECRNLMDRIRRKKFIAKMSIEERKRYNKTLYQNGKIKKYYKKETMLASKINRRDRKNNLDTKINKKDIIKIYHKFNQECFNCKSKDKLTIDHHYPLCEGFGLSEKNAVILCKFCNRSKGTKFPEEFYTKEKLQELQEKYSIFSKEEIGDYYAKK
jgi:hypothetical protein